MQFQFGEFVFDRGSGTLARNGQTVRLQAQPAAALGELLAHSDRIVSREELRRLLWGDDTFVDFDKGLNFCIGQIRAALRDDAARPVYIRTVPKLGYEFIAPVRRIEAAPVPPLTKAGRSKRVLLFGIACACIVFGLALAYRSPRKPEARPILAVVRFDADPNQPQLEALANSLTDDVTVQLTAESKDHFGVIGNAPILRQARDQRSLPEIASALHCSYAVLGQVQSDGGQVLILAHLIRLSDLTHIRVVRWGPTKMRSPLTLESEVAHQIASEFSATMADHPEQAGSFGASSH